MKCQQCKREMVELFTSCRCDWCDFEPTATKLHRGFIVQGKPVRDACVMAPMYYVFRTIGDADRWRKAVGYEAHPIDEVSSLDAFRWQLSRGVISDVVLADHMFEVFQDHRYEPLPHRAFIHARKE